MKCARCSSLVRKQRTVIEIMEMFPEGATAKAGIQIKTEVDIEKKIPHALSLPDPFCVQGRFLFLKYIVCAPCDDALLEEKANNTLKNIIK